MVASLIDLAAGRRLSGVLWGLYAVLVLAGGSPGVVGCGGVEPGGNADAGLLSDGGPDAGTDAGGAGYDGGPDAGPDAGPDGGSATCPPGLRCVDQFPYHDDADTSLSTARTLDGYACAPGPNESGPEIIYQLQVPEAGFLSAAVYDGAGVDIDLQLLQGNSAADCLVRGDLELGVDVAAGRYWLVADSFVSNGVEHAGAYGMDIGFVVPSVGDCSMQTGSLARVGDGGNSLAMPATGPVVEEAHLVSAAEPPPYPQTATQFLDHHYQLSQAATGLVLYRREPWAPLEGGSFYGAGIGSPTLLPLLDEAYYVNMYWRASARPPRGTRMILRLPGSDRAVVVAAGYETGPGNLAHIGGSPEESHFYLGTGHLDTLTLGFSSDPSLPLGPRRCTGP